MFKFFYVLMLICNNATHQCEVKTYYPIDPWVMKSQCEEKVDKIEEAFTRDNTDVIAMCVRTDNGEKEI